jgi:hypothetical protein
VVRVPLADVDRVRAALDAGLDDVVLATVSGALRAYLDAAGHTLDDLRVRALVPTSSRAPSSSPTSDVPAAVRVGGVVVPLPVSESDALARVNALRVDREARHDGPRADTDDVLALAGYAPPALVGLAARLLPRQRAVNLTVATVVGPRARRHLMGAELLDVFSYVGPVDGAALVVTALAYAGTLGFALCADRDAVPDLDVLADGVRSAFDALAKAAATGGART